MYTYINKQGDPCPHRWTKQDPRFYIGSWRCNEECLFKIDCSSDGQTVHCNYPNKVTNDTPIIPYKDKPESLFPAIL